MKELLSSFQLNGDTTRFSPQTQSQLKQSNKTPVLNPYLSGRGDLETKGVLCQLSNSHRKALALLDCGLPL